MIREAPMVRRIGGAVLYAKSIGNGARFIITF